MVSPDPPIQLAICGGGIVGLTLAIGLKRHLGLAPEIFEAADAFVDDVGAGMGIYPNGLRVLREISPEVFESVKSQGHPYMYRRWERHDGTEVAVADENVLADRDDDLQTIGIRRWRLQKVLYEAACELGIPVHFGRRTASVESLPNGTVEIQFEDGTTKLTQILFGADGSKSAVRKSVADCGAQLQYTGVTCLMGIAEDKTEICDVRGIHLPSSSTSQCHGAFFPTGEAETCFQFHFPIAKEDADEGNWSTLTQEVGREECQKLASKLSDEGWHEKYVEPLANAMCAVRIGFCLLDKGLAKFVYGHRGNIVLLGDAAHPPVPYIGQGAQMGLEDAGTIIKLMKELCVEQNGRGGLFMPNNFGNAMKLYEKARIPRTEDVLARSKLWGRRQQKRAMDKKYNEVREELIKRDVFYHETVKDLKAPSGYNFEEGVVEVMKKEPVLLPLIDEEESELQDCPSKLIDEKEEEEEAAELQ